MIRSRWIGAVAGVLTTCVTPMATAQTVMEVNRIVSIREGDKPSRQCRVVKVTSQKDGSRLCEIEALDNGEKLGVVEPAGAKGRFLSFRSTATVGDGATNLKTTVTVSTAPPPLLPDTLTTTPSPVVNAPSVPATPTNWRESWGKVERWTEDDSKKAAELASQRSSASARIPLPVATASAPDPLVSPENYGRNSTTPTPTPPQPSTSTTGTVVPVAPTANSGNAKQRTMPSLFTGRALFGFTAKSATTPPNAATTSVVSSPVVTVAPPLPSPSPEMKPTPAASSLTGRLFGSKTPPLAVPPEALQEPVPLTPETPDENVTPTTKLSPPRATTGTRMLGLFSTGTKTQPCECATAKASMPSVASPLVPPMARPRWGAASVHAAVEEIRPVKGQMPTLANAMSIPETPATTDPNGGVNAFTPGMPTRPVPADMGMAGMPRPGMMPRPMPLFPPQPMTPAMQQQMMAMMAQQQAAAMHMMMAHGMVPQSMNPAYGSGFGSKALSDLRESVLPSEREMAADLLKRTDWKSEPEVLQGLTQAAQSDPSPVVRVACIRALGEMRADTAPVLQALEALRDDSDPRVKAESTAALQILTAKR